MMLILTSSRVLRSLVSPPSSLPACAVGAWTTNSLEKWQWQWQKVHDMFIGADDEQGRSVTDVATALRGRGITHQDVL